MNRAGIQQLCAEALECVRAILPEQAYQDADGWINEYGEWGLGVEHIIDWIGDLDLSIDEAQFAAIERAMVAMGWGESNRMEWLRKEFGPQSQAEADDRDA